MVSAFVCIDASSANSHSHSLPDVRVAHPAPPPLALFRLSPGGHSTASTRSSRCAAGVKYRFICTARSWSASDLSPRCMKARTAQVRYQSACTAHMHYSVYCLADTRPHRSLPYSASSLVTCMPPAPAHSQLGQGRNCLIAAGHLIAAY